MESPSSNRVDWDWGKRGKRVQFDIMPSELGKECNDSFWKRLKSGIEDMDIDYKICLENLNGSREQREPVGVCVEEEEDEVDPDCRMVMNNLAPCDKSCALKVHDGSGVVVLVKYNEVDNSDEYWDSPSLRELSRARINREEMHGEKDWRNLRSKEYVETRRGLRCLQVKERKSSLLEKVLSRAFKNTESYDTERCQKRSRLLNGPGLRQACRESRKKRSVDYKEVEKQRLLRFTGEKEHSISVIRKEIGFERGTGPPLRKSKNATQSEKLEVTAPSRNVINRKDENKRILRSSYEKESRKSVAEKVSIHEPVLDFRTCRRSENDYEDLRNVENSRKVEKRRILRSDRGKEKMHTVAEKKLRCEPWFSPQASSKSKNVIKRKQIEVTNHLRNVERNNHGTEDFEIGYQLFLNGIENEGECVAFVQGGGRVIYEDNCITNISDSDILMWDYDPYSSQDCNNPFVPTKANAYMDGEDSEKEVSLWRRKVMRILKRPYDEKEYKDLFGELKEKKYLHHHPDLKRKIATVRKNRPKLLNILRGFFFWLENVCHEEKVFKPWRDASCLKMVPPSK